MGESFLGVEALPVGGKNEAPACARRIRTAQHFCRSALLVWFSFSQSELSFRFRISAVNNRIFSFVQSRGICVPREFTLLFCGLPFFCQPPYFINFLSSSPSVSRLVQFCALFMQVFLIINCSVAQRELISFVFLQGNF